MATNDLTILVKARLDQQASASEIKKTDIPALQAKLASSKVKIGVTLDIAGSNLNGQLSKLGNLKDLKVGVKLDAKKGVLNNELKTLGEGLKSVEVGVKLDIKKNLLNAELAGITNLKALKVGIKIDASNAELNTQLDKFRLKAIKAPVSLDTTRTGLTQANAQVDELTKKLKAVRLRVEIDNVTLRNLQKMLSTINFGAGGSGGGKGGHGNMNNDGFLGQLSTAMERVPVWMTAMTAFYGTLRAVQSGVQSIVELDSALVGLGKVTELTSSQLQDFVLEANSMGTSLGKSTVEVVKAVTEFSRLGYTMQEAKSLAEEALVYSTVADTDIETANQNIISIIKGFGIEVDREGQNVRRVLDMMNEVGNNYAITSAGISEALRLSASSLSVAGNTIEQSIAMITSANSVVQDPAKVGNALKTVSMRMRGMGEEGEDLSDLMPKLEKDFQKFGLTLKKDDNTFKSTYEMLNDISTVWKDMSDIEKADMLEKIAGKHQGNVVASMIENWKDAPAVMQTAMNSAGSATEEFMKTVDSFAFKINQLKNSIVGFWQENLDTKGMKALVDFATTAVQAFTSLTKAIGILPPITAVLTIALFALKKNLLEASTGSWSLLAGLRELKLGMVMATGATNVLKFALNTLLPVIIFTAIATGIEALITAISDANQKAKEMEENNHKLAVSYKENQTEIASLVSELKKLNEEKDKAKKEGKIFDEKSLERIKEIEQRLMEINPQLVDSIDEQGKGHVKNIERLEEQVKLAKRLAELEAERAKLTFKDKMDDYADKLGNAQQKVKDIQDKIKKLSKDDYFSVDEKNILEERGQDPKVARLLLLNQANHDLALAQAEVNKVQQEGAGIVSESIGTLTGLTEKQQELIDKKSAEISKNKESGDSYENSRRKLEEYKDAMINANKKIEELKKSLADKKISQSDFIASLKQLGTDNVKLWDTKNLDDEGLLGILATIHELIDATGKLNEKNKTIKTGYQDMKTAQQDFSEATQKAQDYNKILADLKDNHKLGADSIQMVTDKYQEFLPYLNDEISLRKAVSDGIELQQYIQQQAYKGMLENSESYFNALGKGYSQLFSGIGTLYNHDFTNFRTIAQAKAEVDKILIENIGANWQKLYKTQAEALRGMAKGISGMMSEMSNPSYLGIDGKMHTAPVDANFKSKVSQQYSQISKLYDLANALDKVNTKINVDSAKFKNVNLGNLNSGYSGADKKPKKEKSQSDKDVEAVKKFLEALKDDAIIKYGLSLNQINQEMAELNNNTKAGIIYKLQEQNMLKSANALYADNAKRIQDQMKRYKPNSEAYKNLRDKLYDYNLEIARNNKQIKEIDKTLIEHNKTLRQQVIDGENMVYQAVENNHAKQKEKIDAQLNLESAVLQAIKDRDEAERKSLEDSTKVAEEKIKLNNEYYDKLLKQEKVKIEQDKKNYEKAFKIMSDAIEKEKKLLQKKYDDARAIEDEAEKQKKLADLQKRYNKIALDNSGLFEKEKLDLQKEIADLQKDMAKDAQDKLLKGEMDALDQQQEALNKEKEAKGEFWESESDRIEQMYGTEETLVDKHYENLRLKDNAYWEQKIKDNEADLETLKKKEEGYTAEVESIMKGSQESILEFLQKYSADYQTATDTQQANLTESWTNTYETWKGIEQDYWDEVKEIMAGGQDKIIEYLKNNTEEYKKAGEKQKQAYLEGWGETLKLYYEGKNGQTSGQISTEYNNSLNNKGGTTSTGTKTTTPTTGGKTTTPTTSNPKVSAITSTLQLGSKGDAVKILQKALNMIVGAGLVVDGDFGNKTKSALIKFQSKYGLKQDGILSSTVRSKFKTLGYSQGGLVDYTGLAMVHGSNSKPEAFLNADQTKLFADLAKLMEKAPLNNINPLMSNIPSGSILVGGDITVTNEISINVPNGINNELDAETLGEMIGKGINKKFEDLLKRSGINRSVQRFR